MDLGWVLTHFFLFWFFFFQQEAAWGTPVTALHKRDRLDSLDRSRGEGEFYRDPDTDLYCRKCPAGEMLPKVDHALCSLVTLLQGWHVLVFARWQPVLQLSPALLS